ncbi:hypothetical protein TTHERM_001021889 (macronuclear) [Tetrahymena thermophila SB210]|uniref:Uncharacterized protein n=1 Tax=Tetrahymena thermophila (strain SB210) TaxID=312017 RepID=W7X9E5_TETTS|nr:hypothetical protein TTHERM_001021889 [Tetrahymena thermophila SB210]EWS76025.1 hypothetical protein TTHERM_001021889 [Tetrahymena thermophila SB210]|eukprot:XP_012651430.1 hypothetical protein TTHERM_001021889 [Tetrahymena thermophila SB210]
MVLSNKLKALAITKIKETIENTKIQYLFPLQQFQQYALIGSLQIGQRDMGSRIKPTLVAAIFRVLFAIKNSVGLVYRKMYSDIVKCYIIDSTQRNQKYLRTSTLTLFKPKIDMHRQPTRISQNTKHQIISAIH